ncbi:hypothetical protein GCM10023093_32000 [Nemorincola caseinilytica]|uniref:Uncharacterized protein n=1 Tax=Nemorincola caseinilytica TaxID=2054315 RepID=A0ABP8NPD5_9BACT
MYKAHAQLQVDKSEVLDEEYTRGFHCILQLKNGSTFIMRGGTKNRCEVMLIDKERKRFAVTEVRCEHVKINDVLLGIYEINGEPVLFFKESYGYTPSVYRLRFHPQTGALVAEDLIYDFPRLGMAAMKGNVNNNIVVVKDPASDCYAIGIYRSVGERNEDRIRTIHYDGHHKLLSNVVVPYPASDILNFYIMSIAVNGDKNLFLAAYGAESLLYKNGRVYLARINADNSIPKMKPLDLAHDLRQTNAILLYDNRRNALHMLMNTEVRQGVITGGVHAYTSSVLVIDPETLNTRSVHDLSAAKVTEAKKKIPGKSGEFSGVPQNILLHEDGSTVILMEEMKYQEPSAFGSTAATMTLGDIGILVLEGDSVERTGYYIERRQPNLGTPNPNVMRMHGVDVITTNKDIYLLANEIGENIKRKEEGKRLKTLYRMDRQMVCYALHGGKAEVLQLQEKGTQEEAIFEDFTLRGNYNEATHTFATITKANEGSEKVARVRWIGLE